jgi:dihydroxyacetone kinase-like predicted kinase
MQTMELTSLAPATLAALGKLVAEAAKEQRDELAPGKHTVDEIVTLKVDGTVSVSADTTRAPTCSIPLLPTLALMAKRMGIQRESAFEILRSVMTEALSLGKDATTELLAQSGVEEAMEKIQEEIIAKLPRTPAKGKVVVDGTAMAVGIGISSTK